MPPSDATIQYPPVASAVRTEPSAARAVWVVGAARGRNAVTATATVAASRRRSRLVSGVSEGITAPLQEGGLPRKAPLRRTAAGPLDYFGWLAVEGRSERDGTGRRVTTQRAGEGLVGEVEDASVSTHHHVAGAVADHAGDRLVELDGTERAEEGR